MTAQGMDIKSAPHRFIIPVRVYYEDTDAGGIVYHASFLRFMERARTDLLRYLRHERSRLASEFDTQFVVTEIGIKYRKPAFMDDMLESTVFIKSLGLSRTVFEQTIERGGEALVMASVKAACISVKSKKPVPIPETLREKMKGLM